MVHCRRIAGGPILQLGCCRYIGDNHSDVVLFPAHVPVARLVRPVCKGRQVSRVLRPAIQSIAPHYIAWACLEMLSLAHQVPSGLRLQPTGLLPTFPMFLGVASEQHAWHSHTMDSTDAPPQSWTAQRQAWLITGNKRGHRIEHCKASKGSFERAEGSPVLGPLGEAGGGYTRGISPPVHDRHHGCSLLGKHVVNHAIRCQHHHIPLVQAH